MKKAIIFYFTSTGNTQEVLAMLMRALDAEGIQTDCLQIENCTIKSNIRNIADYDAIGIGYPVWAFNAPVMVERFLKTLPRAENKPVFVFTTAGEPFFLNNVSSHWIGRILKKRGYIPNYERHFIMPYNINFRYPDEIVKELYALAEKLSIQMARELANGVLCPPKWSPVAIPVSFVLRLQRPLSKLNGRLYKTDAACNGCQKCVRECGSGNISLESGRIKFGWKCMMCMRCVMYCPQGAIKAGLINGLAVRGPYDFKRIMNDPAIRKDTIQNCGKGFFKYFKKYVKEMEELTSEVLD